MKWLRRSDLLPVPTHPTPPSGSKKQDPSSRPANDAVVEQTSGSSETTERSAIPKEIDGPASVSLVTGVPRPKGVRQMSATLASPIPAMLAESMGLALEKDPGPAKAAPGAEVSPEALLVFGAAAVKQVNDLGEKRDSRPAVKPAAKDASQSHPRTPHRR